MLRQAVVLGGRAVIPVAMGLVLTSPGFARAAEVGAGSPSESVTRAQAAAAAAPVIGSAFHADDPVSRRAEGPGHDRGDDHGGQTPDVVQAPAGDDQVPGEAGSVPQPGAPAAQGEGTPGQTEPGSGTSSLPAQSGIGEPARIAIADALRISSPLPVLIIDAPARGALTRISGRLRATRVAMRVEIALRRGGSRQGCSWWTPRHARFSAASRAACGRPQWIRTTLRRSAGGWRWQARMGGRVPRGAHSLLVRVLDRHGRPVDVERR